MTQPDPAQYQPPITLWGRIWRYVLTIVIGALAWVEFFEDQWRDHRPWIWVALGVGVLSYALLPFRRRWPVTVAVLTNLLSIVSAPAAGPSCLALVSLATRRRYREVALLAVVTMLAGIAFYELPIHPSPDPFWFNLVFSAIVTAALIGWGLYIGSRRELLWRLRDQVRRAGEEQELRTDQARSAERSRIAREMHDVLAHRISQIAMHAGALAFREDLSAAELRKGAGEIQARAHEALDDLRGVLGVLRDDGGQLAPQPTYADLACLIEETRSAGAHVDYEDRLTVPPSDAVGRTVYRIVQEGLTNAGKHAPGAHVAITLGGSPETGVTVTLRNPLGFRPSGTPGAGLGLVGLRERAELLGGRLDSRYDHGSFILRGWLPWSP